MTRVTSQMVDRAAELVAAGRCPSAAARAVGAHPASILRHLRARGVLEPQQRRRSVLAELSPTVVADAVRTYEAGFGIRAVGDRLMVSYESARKLLRDQGVTLRPIGGRAGTRRG